MLWRCEPSSTDKCGKHSFVKVSLYSKWRASQKTTVQGRDQQITESPVPTYTSTSQLLHQGTSLMGNERFKMPGYQEVSHKIVSPGNGYINKSETIVVINGQVNVGGGNLATSHP